jgi:hypothetical protein
MKPGTWLRRSVLLYYFAEPAQPAEGPRRLRGGTWRTACVAEGVPLHVATTSAQPTASIPPLQADLEGRDTAFRNGLRDLAELILNSAITCSFPA